MPIIEMRNQNIETGTGHSSKGNQLKWKQDNWWYKVDAFGYESLSEVMTSKLLQKSNLSEFVIYEPVQILYEGNLKRGCCSRNFKKENYELISLEHLCRNATGFGLAKTLSRIADIKERILYTIEMVNTVTGLTDFDMYLLKILEMDAFFLNEDRHTNNIAILYNLDTEEYELCPFFDMGLALFSDTKEMYLLNKSLEECRKAIKAKPFSRDFDEQLNAINEIKGSYLKFSFKSEQMYQVCNDIIVQMKEDTFPYTKEETDRVIETLCYQASKYRDMF